MSRNSRKLLTVAIAGALAAPMAAQAVDMTVSGHINRSLFVTDSDQASSTSANVGDNGGSGTRIRVTGSGEMMDGGAAGVNHEYGATSTLGLRYAGMWYSGGYGKVTIGQSEQAGEGSVYHGAAAVFGTGHGQDNNGVAGNYYTSLDGGAGRNERLRYDTPALGPVSAAVSIGNGDQVSAGLKLSQEMGGASYSAGIGTIQWAGGQSTISASAGVTLDSGVSISGDWTVTRGCPWPLPFCPQPPCGCPRCPWPGPFPLSGETESSAVESGFIQLAIAYTGVGVSGNRSKDFMREESKGTALGIGATHTLTKVGVDPYAAVLNYSDKWPSTGAKTEVATVFGVGAPAVRF